MEKEIHESMLNSMSPWQLSHDMNAYIHMQVHSTKLFKFGRPSLSKHHFNSPQILW